MDNRTRALLAAAGAAAEKTYVEDVFSTYLYTGNGSTQTITNEIDLAGEGGLVWIKHRSGSLSSIQHALYDTSRGPNKTLQSSGAQSELTTTDTVTSFGSSGFTLGADATYGTVNFNSSQNYVSWTFRKAPKFFDVVTWTGNGSGGATVSHNLGSTPGFIVYKATTSTGNWFVYHRSLGTSGSLTLNTTDADPGYGRVTAVSSTSFTTDGTGNASGVTYVAYLFAHDAGGFGDDGNDNVISCGSFTSGSTVNLGWEPQWVLFKRSDSAQTWLIADNMRGLTTSSNAHLYPNTSEAEYSNTFFYVAPTATGFEAKTTVGGTYIYIAIRRGPMKTPTDATKVFSAVTKSVDNTFTSTGHVVDLLIESKRTSVNTTYQHLTLDRLRGTNALTTFSTAAEYAGVVSDWSSSSTGFNATNFYAPATGDYLFWSFRRAPGFFDVVAYTGTGAARTVAHNLGVAPELMIVKSRTTARNWQVYFGNNLAGLILNTTIFAQNSPDYWNDTSPTATVFTVGQGLNVNESGAGYTAYLFASCPGVSKVGSYTGTGTTLDIDCGFTSGARFVLIKRTDSTGDWYVWDTARGIVSGNDSYLLLNSTAAENTSTDYIDPLSSGFQISSTAPAAINANGGSFIFLAIA